MKKQLLFSLLALFFYLNSYSQNVRITAMVEGDCPTGSIAPRVIELYVEGTVDVTNLRIQFQFASAPNWTLNTTIGAGEYTDTFLYLVNDIDAFDENFPDIRTPSNTTFGTIISSVEGGDKVRLVDGSNDDAVIDIFGFDGQNGENTTWNFSNSYVKRNPGSGPSEIFTESEWDIKPKNTLLFEGICWEEDALNSIVGLQSFTLSNENFLLNRKKIGIYPNPSSANIQLIGLEITQQYSIYDMSGRQVSKGKALPNANIDISTLNSGVYFIKTEQGGVSKFIKE